MIEEFDGLVAYESHSELDDQGNKKTPLSIASRFTNQVGSTASSSSTLRTQPTGAVTSFDNGPTSAGVSSSTTTVSKIQAQLPHLLQMPKQAQPVRVPAVVLLLVPPLVLAVLVQVLAVLLDLDLLDLDLLDPQVEDTMVGVINNILP